MSCHASQNQPPILLSSSTYNHNSYIVPFHHPLSSFYLFFQEKVSWFGRFLLSVPAKYAHFLALGFSLLPETFLSNPENHRLYENTRSDYFANPSHRLSSDNGKQPIHSLSAWANLKFWDNIKHLRSSTLLKSTNIGGVFAWQNVYSSEVKWAVVKEKLSGELTTKEIIEKYGIKKKSQVETWMRWYRSNELYRLDQPIGKQYTYGHGPDSASEDDKREWQISHLKMENEILKKYMETERELRKK